MAKKCRSCRGEIENPFSSTQTACSPLCAIALARKAQEKKDKAKAKGDRKAHREAKERLKTKGDWTKEAQKEFNKFIRLRDKHQPCISCDRESVEMTVGGAWDCGHYLSRGGFPELRFEELNAHKQCKSCNGGSGKYAKKAATVAKAYRSNIINKIGLEKVEWLEGPHEPKRYTIENLKEIKEAYKQKAKELGV